MPEWKKYGYRSYEQWIEAKAGSCPKIVSPKIDSPDGKDDWPFPPEPPYAADDEDKERADA